MKDARFSTSNSAACWPTPGRIWPSGPNSAEIGQHSVDLSQIWSTTAKTWCKSKQSLADSGQNSFELSLMWPNPDKHWSKSGTFGRARQKMAESGPSLVDSRQNLVVFRPNSAELAQVSPNPGLAHSLKFLQLRTSRKRSAQRIHFVARLVRG